MQQLILIAGVAGVIGLFIWFVVFAPTWLHNRQRSRSSELRRRNRELTTMNGRLRKTLGDTFTTLQLVSGASADDRLLLEEVRDQISDVLIDTHIASE